MWAVNLRLLAYALALGVLAAAAYAGCERIYQMGATSVQLKWDAAKLAAAQAVAARKDSQQAVTVRVETQYVDRWHTIVEQGKTITKEITRYVPASAPALPGGWRVLHDAAASGALTFPDPASSAGAAPVSAQDAAATVTDNYAGCRANTAQVEAWQEWAAAQMELSRTRSGSGESK